MCTSATSTTCGSETTPAGPLLFNSGGGGGTSYIFAQPKYQAGVVPTSLSERNSPLIGPVPTRTVPDISLDADAQTGMLIGLTQTFGDTVQYDQFKEGGTSLASPLMAGVTADAIGKSGGGFGLLNPLIYKMEARDTKGAIRDVTAPADPNREATVRVDYANTQDASNGYIVSLRVLDYEGPETYCDGDGNCATRNVTLNARNGYDELTGVGSPGDKFVTQLSKF
jgi:subtilase family serine protease